MSTVVAAATRTRPPWGSVSEPPDASTDRDSGVLCRPDDESARRRAGSPKEPAGLRGEQQREREQQRLDEHDRGARRDVEVEADVETRDRSDDSDADRHLHEVPEP